MDLTVVTDMNEACIPSSNTMLLLLILSVCWNGAVQNMTSLVLAVGKLVYFMQWLCYVVHLGMTLYSAVEEPLLYGLVTVYINLLSSYFFSSTSSFIIIFVTYVVHIICTYMLVHLRCI